MATQRYHTPKIQVQFLVDLLNHSSRVERRYDSPDTQVQVLVVQLIYSSEVEHWSDKPEIQVRVLVDQCAARIHGCACVFVAQW